jgi:hypothetical protein
LWGLSQLTLETAILQKHSIMKGSFTEALIWVVLVQMFKLLQTQISIT